MKEVFTYWKHSGNKVWVNESNDLLGRQHLKLKMQIPI